MIFANDDVSICANCGKEGSDVKNTCNKCKQVVYCNAACKKKHRHKHKKDCEEHRRQAAEVHDEKLFKQPPVEDCPICFLRMPYIDTGSQYMTCCGKVICTGCIYAPVYDDQGNELAKKTCPFCRASRPSSDEEALENIKKRVEANDPHAIYRLGLDYMEGSCGLPQDYKKALELWHQAAELGYTPTYLSIGHAYDFGEGVEVDENKATYYYELAAMGGDVCARHNLGIDEARAGNWERALKHLMMAVEGGKSDSLKAIQKLYSNGYATKDDYNTALQLYQTYLGEIKSVQRDKAAAADEDNCY